MGWLSNLFTPKPEPRFELSDDAKDILWNRPTAKTDERQGKLTDPQGLRIYHEYFIGEDRGDGHCPWSCRVYTHGELRAEKNGLAASDTVARAQALSWAENTKAAVHAASVNRSAP